MPTYNNCNKMFNIPKLYVSHLALYFIHYKLTTVVEFNLTETPKQYTT